MRILYVFVGLGVLAVLAFLAMPIVAAMIGAFAMGMLGRSAPPADYSKAPSMVYGCIRPVYKEASDFSEGLAVVGVPYNDKSAK